MSIPLAQSKAPAQRVLIVSYEFDTTVSPQGLRWVRLSDELAKSGWEVDILTAASLPGEEARAQIDSEVRRPRIHRFFPGPYYHLTRGRRTAPPLASGAHQGKSGNIRTADTAGRLNWKGQLDAWLLSLSARWLYPDLRRESLPFLRRAITQLLATNPYQAVILSHEPPLALETRDLFLRAGVPVVADLGDPVCATYTPRRWRNRALKLERAVCQDSSALVVTTEATLKLMFQRHTRLPAHTEVISQGYQASRSRKAKPNPEEIRIVYTGRFYRFRNPTAVLAAVARSSGVVLDLATPQMPDWLNPDLVKSPHVRVHTGLDHADALGLQADADVLLVIGNDDPDQTPGKLFEYLGTLAPILYVTRHGNDPGAAMVLSLRRGVVVPNDPDEVFKELQKLRALHQSGQLRERFDLSEERIRQYSWRALAARYSQLLQEVARQRIRPDHAFGNRDFHRLIQ